MLQPWKQTAPVEILCNISRQKGDHAMKFGQLIEYNMGSFFFFFLKNHAQNVMDKLFLDHSLKYEN